MDNDKEKLKHQLNRETSSLRTIEKNLAEKREILKGSERIEHKANLEYKRLVVQNFILDKELDTLLESVREQLAIIQDLKQQLK